MEYILITEFLGPKFTILIKNKCSERIATNKDFILTIRYFKEQLSPKINWEGIGPPKTVNDIRILFILNLPKLCGPNLMGCSSFVRALKSLTVMKEE